MRLPLSWLREYADLPSDATAEAVAERLTAAGLKVESVEAVGVEVAGVAVGAVTGIEELTGLRKPIRYCQVDDGTQTRSVICGATNFDVGDRVALARPGARLPGGVEISARRTYGHVSDGMICSVAELGIGDDHSGILVLPPATPLGVDLVDALGLRDDVLDLEITPDRGYCLSVRGVAREAATAYGVDFRDPAVGAAPDGDGDGDPHRGLIEAPEAADRLVLWTLGGLDPRRLSPLWLTQRLRLAGVRPVHLAVDLTNYLMLELGQPLHAFDRATLSGPIRIRRAQPGEHLTTLDHVDRPLDPQDIVIADDSGPLSLAGLMGGLASEVGPATTDLVIEAAHFEPAAVAAMSRRHRLASEASRRFERGVDPALPPVAAGRAAALLVELGGAVAQGVVEIDRPRARATVTFDVDLPGRVAGVTYDRATVTGRLADIGCAVTSDGGGGPSLTVIPPSWRPDLVEPFDLVEEVVRLEGYDQIPSTLPRTPAGRGLTTRQRQRREVGRRLAGAGYVEVLTVPFVAASLAAAFGLAADDPRRAAVAVANPLSEEESLLRASLLPGLLTALRRNVGLGLVDVALFEEGLVFRSGAAPGGAPALPVDRRPTDEQLAALDAALPDQPRQLAVVLAGARVLPGWPGPGRPAIWADAVEAARTVAATLRAPLTVRRATAPPWHPVRCAALQLAEQTVGYAGELHPRVVNELELPPRTVAMELHLDRLLDAAGALTVAPALSPYPPASQDVALVVDETVPAADVEAALRVGAGPLLESLRLFDVYAGGQIGAGRRSLAFALRFRAPDRTLTVDEASAARDAAVAEATRRTGAVLRGG